MNNPHRLRTLIILGVLLLVAGLSLTGAAAQSIDRPLPEAVPLHPQFALLDADEVNVLTSGQPVSTLKTCGACHDTAFIQSHSDHASVGLDEFGQPGTVANGRTWDTSPGAFGRWDPLRYRYLSPAGDPLLDQGTPDWVQDFGDRHVGGGPALNARNGQPLTDAVCGRRQSGNRSAGSCHGQGYSLGLGRLGRGRDELLPVPLARPQQRRPYRRLTERANSAGPIPLPWWAPAWWNARATARIAPTGGTRPRFDADGQLKPEFVTVQDPTNANCGQCHGLVHTDAKTPVTLTPKNSSWADQVSQLNATLTTGQIIAGQKIADSGMNLAGKADLDAALGRPRRPPGQVHRLPLLAQQPGLLPGKRRYPPRPPGLRPATSGPGRVPAAPRARFCWKRR